MTVKCILQHISILIRYLLELRSGFVTVGLMQNFPESTTNNTFSIVASNISHLSLYAPRSLNLYVIMCKCVHIQSAQLMLYYKQEKVIGCSVREIIQSVPSAVYRVSVMRVCIL